MKIDLNVGERISLSTILPKEGNISDVRHIKKLREEIELTKEEIDECSVTSIPQGMISWKIDKIKSIEFDDVDKGIIKLALNKLEETKKIRIDYISLWEKFMETK